MRTIYIRLRKWVLKRQKKLEWPKRAFECEQKNSYGIEHRYDMTRINDKEVNKIAEWNLLHNIINPTKHAATLNSHYSPILHGCMNSRKIRANFKNFRIILDNGFSSTIVMGRLVEGIHLEKDAVMQWQKQAGNITTDLKVKLFFNLSTLSATNFMTRKCHVDDSAKGTYDMILGIYQWTEL